jgi:hypothetical protein
MDTLLQNRFRSRATSKGRAELLLIDPSEAIYLKTYRPKCRITLGQLGFKIAPPFSSRHQPGWPAWLAFQVSTRLLTAALRDA